MKERLFNLFRLREFRRKTREGTWHWLHFLIVNDHIDDVYTYKPHEIQLGVDDLLTQIYDIHNNTTFESVLKSAEKSGTKALGHVIGLVSRHGAGWSREEVLEISSHATRIYSCLSASSPPDADTFLDIVKSYHPNATVENNVVSMNIVKGKPHPVKFFKVSSD